MSSFRKRNVFISKKGEVPASAPQKQSTPGTRPSPVTGHTTTSTGTESLDRILGLGAGLALGSSLIIEEEGTTEFARSLLSCYAAEGVLQGHAVFVVGPEASLTLPGLWEEKESKRGKPSVESEKMKIAWRYERLGAFEERERGGFSPEYCCVYLQCYGSFVENNLALLWQFAYSAYQALQDSRRPAAFQDHRNLRKPFKCSVTHLTSQSAWQSLHQANHQDTCLRHHHQVTHLLSVQS